MKAVIRKFRTLARDPERAILGKLAPMRERAARAYALANGFDRLLRANDAAEIKAEYWDLAFLHQAVIRRRPKAVLEFGCGFSTLVLADALRRTKSGRLYTVDTSERWLGNTRAKLGELAEHAELRHSTASLHLHAGQPVSFYDALPNVVPDMVYLDGPDPMTVQGSFNGLSFQTEDGFNRSVCAADLLLYEPSLAPGTLVVVDGRVNNVAFLRGNLRRDWRIRTDRVMKHTTMVLRR